jgi:hypothetical protein
MGSTVTQEFYGIKVTTILNAAEKLTSDLDYLYALVEQPDEEFIISNALAYACAVTALSAQLAFVVEDLAENDLSEDELYVKLSTDEIHMLNMYTEQSEGAMKDLEELCGISLQSN